MDLWIFQKINNLAGQCDFLDMLGIFLARWLAYILVAAFFIFLILVKDKKLRWQIFFSAALAAVASRLLFTELVRLIWSRSRPFEIFDIKLLVPHEAGASFPSGHMAFFFALAMVVFLFNKKVGIWFLAASFFMGIARIFVGVHYPSDILAGIVLGVIVGYFFYFFFQKRKKESFKNEKS